MKSSPFFCSTSLPDAIRRVRTFNNDGTPKGLQKKRDHLLAFSRPTSSRRQVSFRVFGSPLLAAVDRTPILLKASLKTKDCSTKHRIV